MALLIVAGAISLSPTIRAVSVTLQRVAVLSERVGVLMNVWRIVDRGEGVAASGNPSSRSAVVRTVDRIHLRHSYDAHFTGASSPISEAAGVGTVEVTFPDDSQGRRYVVPPPRTTEEAKR